ncbi:MAG: c-type cytochrome [Pyrinomonadaceae bacterium]
MKTRLKIFAIVIALVFGGIFLAEPGKSQSKTETAGQKFKSIKVLNDMPADQMGKVMNMMSASLGVDCKFCHASNDGDYEKDGNENKETARKMIKMVFDLNKTQFNGRPEINCNSCHNGRSHPQPSFPLTAAVPALQRPEQPTKKPTVDEIIAKYETALGGRTSLEEVTSRIIKSTRVEPDGKTTEPETIYLKGGKYASDTTYDKYVVREVFDGVVGQKFGMADPIELKPDEKEQIKREAEMFSPANLKLTFPKMDYRSADRIDGKDVYLVLATTAGNLRERLYFDVMSGLLVRRIASSPTVFGNFVYQVDYSDYKDFGGVKLPTTTKYAVPHIQWTRKISEVKNNVPVDDGVFGPVKK